MNRRFVPVSTFLALVAATGVLIAGEPPPSLLVQAAMQKAKDALARKDAATAVRVLEEQLPKINGHPQYLALLEEAYRVHVRNLRESGRQELALTYLERLAVLDPTVSLNQPASAAPGGVVVRGNGEDDKGIGAGELALTPAQALAMAEREFAGRHYTEAAELFQKAAALESGLPPISKERWAYCKLHLVTERLNSQAAQDWAGLEREVRTALSLAPRLEFGHQLLRAIAERAKSAAPSAARLPVRHLPERSKGWLVAESANFRVFHADPALAEEVLQVAERTRVAVARKWLGEANPPDWPQKCDVYLHATAQAYSRATGVPAESPGHSSVGAERHDASRIHSRQLDLHVDDPNMLHAVLPHETTHVVLSGQFGPKPLPRWADEGMAVLSEPYERIFRHLRPLPQAFQEGRVLTGRQLMEMEDYPPATLMAAFYGQSVALVDYLTEQRGPQVFVQFLRDAQREGYEAALRRHYGLNGHAELESRWQNYILAGRVLGQGKPEKPPRPAGREIAAEPLFRTPGE